MSEKTARPKRVASENAIALVVDDLPFDLTDDLITSLEQQILEGRSRGQIVAWARRYGVERKDIGALLKVIRALFDYDESGEKEFARTRRDRQRRRYLMVFAAALSDKNFTAALSALGRLDVLDGLALPDMSVNLVNVNADVTNKTRERAMELIAKMQGRSAASEPVIDVEAPADEDEEE